MQIIPLIEVPQHVDLLAQWICEEWHAGYDREALEEVKTILRGGPTSPPTVVALDGEAPIGVLGFRRVMLRGREPLLLFINSLLVLETHRGRGIGTALLNDALGRVAPEDSCVYVYAAIPAWYQARGFVVVEPEDDAGNTVLRASRPF